MTARRRFVNSSLSPVPSQLRDDLIYPSYTHHDLTLPIRMSIPAFTSEIFLACKKKKKKKKSHNLKKENFLTLNPEWTAIPAMPDHDGHMTTM
jgi:hypothetical protein